jgi:hypothetical protein
MPSLEDFVPPPSSARSLSSRWDDPLAHIDDPYYASTNDAAYLRAVQRLWAEGNPINRTVETVYLPGDAPD